MVTPESGLGAGGEVPYFEGTRKETEKLPSPPRRVSFVFVLLKKERRGRGKE